MHKGEVYNGEHDALIAQATWDRTQAQLARNAPNRSLRRNTKSKALLAGLLEDSDGHPLVPQTCTTRGKTYRYYVSRNLKTGDADTGWRLPANTIETLVLSMLKNHLSDDLKLFKLLKLDEVDVTRQQAIMASAKELASSLKKPTQEQFHALVETIVVRPDNLTIKLSHAGLAFHLPIDDSEIGGEDSHPCIIEPMTLRRRGQEVKMVLGEREEPISNPDDALILLVARAALLREQLEAGQVTSISEFADRNGLHHSDAKKLGSLGYLAPSIVEDILNGQQPAELTARDLHRMTDLPLCWSLQRQRLGFHSASA